MLKRIKVQGKLSLLAAIVISVVVASITIYFIYISITSDYLSSGTKTDIWGLVGMIAVFIPLWLNNAKSEEEYVSELILDDCSLTLVYKNHTNERKKKILLSDINSFNVVLNANNAKTGKTVSLFCETIVTINTKSSKKISFRETPTASFAFCNYAFMLRLLDIAKYLPNFKYEVKGNSETTKLDIANYALHGKRLSWLKRGLIEFNQYPAVTRYIVILCLLMPILLMGFYFYLLFPTSLFLSDADKEYVSYIDNGYSYFQNNMFNKSLLEYDKALNIHNNDSHLYLYRAYTYYDMEQYEKAAQEAEKGIDCLNKKSIYNQAKNWRLTNDDISLYTKLGDSEQLLKNYKKAIEAYDYVADNVKYKYTDIYIKRGICKYHLGKKEAALRDFMKHKEIIEKYLEDEANSEFKSDYPTYTRERDLNNTYLWIRACQY